MERTLWLTLRLLANKTQQRRVLNRLWFFMEDQQRLKRTLYLTLRLLVNKTQQRRMLSLLEFFMEDQQGRTLLAAANVKLAKS